MTDLDAYKDKFSESGQRILESALGETRRRGQNFISIANLFYALMDEESDLFNAAMKERSIDPQTVRAAVEKRLNTNPQFNGVGFRIAPETTEIFKLSMERARIHGRRTIEASDILQILIHHPHNGLDDILLNPEGSRSDARTIHMEARRLVYSNQLKSQASVFMMNFSLNELIKKSDSPSARICAQRHTGGRGGWMSNDDSTVTIHSKHEYIYFEISPEEDQKLNQLELMLTLEKDICAALAQSGLEIINTGAAGRVSFRAEYKNIGMSGWIEVSGEIQKEYYELKSLIEERSNRGDE